MVRGHASTQVYFLLGTWDHGSILGRKVFYDYLIMIMIRFGNLLTLISIIIVSAIL